MSKYTKPVLNVGDVIYGTDPTTGIEDPAAFVKAVREIIDGASPSHTDGEDGKPIYRRLREQSN